MQLVKGDPRAFENEAYNALRLRKAAKSYFGASVLSDTGWNVMLALYTFHTTRRCTIRAVAERAGVPRNTTLRALMRLQSHGFVTLVPDPKDKRAIQVQITSKGFDAMKKSFLAAETTRL